MRVLERLQLEFRGRVELSPVFWEHEVLKATDTFQSQIPRAADADVCIFILWSWFGTPLPADFRRPDGTTYRSGTEFEFEDAIGSFQNTGSPDILVYRKTADVAIPTRDRARELEWRTQRDALFEFVDRWFRGEGGSFKAAFHEFEKQQQFEDVLETHLRRWIEDRLRASSENVVEPESALWKGSPYRGLERFDFDHALIYCGRTQAVAEAIDALRRLAERGTPFLLVAGMSGAGKSSFARAGVLPMLVQPRVIEGDIAWRWATLRPGDVPDAPLESVAAALLSDGALPELAEGGMTRAELAAMLGERPDAALPMLSLALARAASARSGRPAESAKLVLVVDQLDEIFTQASITEETRNAFANALAALARSGKVWVIATLRSDLFARMAELPSAFSELAHGDGFYELRAPSPAEIGQMIRRPARIAGVTFERRADTDEGLDDVLRDAAAAQPASLPLLEFALDEMLKSCTATKTLTFAAYEALGGLEGALRARAEGTFAALTPAAQAALSAVIARLVQVRLDGVVGQTRAKRAALDAIAGGTELVDAFVAARLFVVDRGADGKPVVGVAHEALLREWPRVSGWIEENRAFLNVRARVAAAQALWTAADCSEPNLLPSGRLLQEAEALLGQRSELLSEHERAFVEASLQRAARERRSRQLLWAAAAALVLVIAGGAVAYWDAYFRDYVTYARGIDKRWGVFAPRGILSADEVQRRNSSFRYHQRGRFGPIVKVDVVNGAGSCPQTSYLTLYIGGDLSNRNFTSRRPCSWEFEVDANGHARVEQGFDFMGRPVYSFRYSDQGANTAEYYTAEGLAASGAHSGASRIIFERIPSGPDAGLENSRRFIDAYGRPKPNHERAYGQQMEYDEHRNQRRITYVDRDGKPTPNADGITIAEAEYNEHGDAISWRILDAAGRPTRSRYGYSKRVIEYDAVGNETSYKYYDENDKPFTLEDGYFEIRRSFDKHGNIELISYYDTAGRLTRIKSGEAQFRQKYDKRGWVEEVSFLDEDGKPVRTTGGMAGFRNEYDAESNIVSRTYFNTKGGVWLKRVVTFVDGLPRREVYKDESGRPFPLPRGYSGLEMSYRNGLETERVFLDGEGHAIKSVHKYAKQKIEYDERGNAVAMEYLDEHDALILNDEGYAKIKRHFNETGDADEEVYLGTDGRQPKDIDAGYARVRRRYDELGRAVEVRYFDASDSPRWPKDGCSFRRTYDAQGREAQTVCIDANLKPALHPHGWARKELVHDAVGHLLRESYIYSYGPGAPASEKPRIGRIERSYDAWGNVTTIRYFDEFGVAAKGGDFSCHQTRWRYNRRNLLSEETCLGADDKPSPRSDGSYRVVIARNDEDRILYRTFYMLRTPPGWPTSIDREYKDERNRLRRAEFLDENGVARMTRDYDERRRIIKTEYFDARGRPEQGPGGFAKFRVLAFDDFGGADMEFEDEQGRPVEPAILVKGVKVGGPGARAGVRRNDVILRYDGKRIHFGIFAAAQRAPAGAAGAMRELVVLRDNALVTMQVEPVPLQLEIEPVRRPASEAGGGGR